MGSRLLRTIYKADVTAPPTPSGLTVGIIDDDRATLACGVVYDTAGHLFEASGTVSYKWYQATSEGGTYSLITTTTSPTHKVTGLNPLTTYWWAVSATDGTNESATNAEGEVRRLLTMLGYRDIQFAPPNPLSIPFEND